MKRLRHWIRNWFGFSRTEVNGFIILLPLMILLVMSEPLYRLWISTRPRDFSAERRKLDSLVAAWNEKADSTAEKKYNPKFQKTPFDPNKIPVAALKAMGFPDHLSKRIANYREKGGVFRIKADLLKIYGVDSTFYHQLYAFILLPEKLESKTQVEKVSEIVHKRPASRFDLNAADSVMLKTVYGIGPVLASRIMKFRNALGGFVNLVQLKEVYGLDSTAVRNLTERSYIDTEFNPVKININTADEKLLSSHPYITRSMAKAVVAYRFQHGSFRDVEDARKVFITLTPSEAEKLIPYLAVHD